MKTRTSLVSNSSSSSFILIGIPINISDLNESHVIPSGKSKPTLETVVTGKYLEEGRDIFTLTEPGQLAFIKDNPELFTAAYIKCLYIYDPSEPYSIKNLIDAGVDSSKMVVYGGKADQNSSYCLNSMLENYEQEISEKVKQNIKEVYRKKYTPK